MMYPIGKERIISELLGRMTLKRIVQRCAQLMLSAEAIENMRNIQRQDGNWNYCEYMHGYANGIELCFATVLGIDPDFLDAPSEWKGESKSAEALKVYRAMQAASHDVYQISRNAGYLIKTIQRGDK